MKKYMIPILASIVAGGMTFATASDELIRLYEEEILAHDLYVELGRIHPEVRPFQNIPQSEKRHREAMAGILKRENIDIPQPVGSRKFVTPGLDQIYQTWLTEGRRSKADACRVGVRLEEHDIADLRKASKGFPDHREVLQAFESASGNHLRAFHRNLTANDGAYVAEVLGEEELKRLLSEKSEKGSRRSCGAGTGKRKQIPNSQGGPGRQKGFRGGR